MARPLRIEFPGAWYHVTSRGNERKSIFADDQDRRRFLEILASTVETYRVQLHAYALMANHFHLLLVTSEANLGSFMQRLNTAYTVYFNRRHRRVGHFLQGRYKAILIDADSHLAEISRYVHLNPVRIKKYSRREIGFKKKVLSAYLWSSYPGYVSLTKRQPFMSHDTVVSVVGGKDDVRGRRAYRDFVLGGIAKDMNITYWSEVRGQVVLGSDEFLEWIREKILRKQAGKVAADKAYSGYGELLPRVDVPAIAGRVAELFEVEAEALLIKRSRHRQARRFLLGLCYDLLGGTMALAEIGQELGPVGAAALCRNRVILQGELKDNKKLSKKYSSVLRELRK
ncbi:MAG: transposase [Deltaproteobacteria bacterium]|nr:MAG: transposase [Deltaproteobacteria bacterium]